MAYLVIVLLVLLILGGDRLASFGRGLGAARQAFKKAVRPPEDRPEALPRRVIVVSAEPLPDDDASKGPKEPNGSEPREGS